jgi:wyosine [tRNA(Phe)-imidazoG37] synthetase (radical SAM superfamily)
MRAPLTPFFTYTLHNALYVPFTSLCNTLTLPETRGPNFLLPPHVVASLLRVRDAEFNTQQWAHWCMYLDGVDNAQKLPVSSAERIQEYPTSQTVQPQVQDLLKEIQDQISQPGNDLSSIVISGEGEPTLRLDDVLSLAKLLADTSFTSSIPLRLTTNGIVPAADTAEQLKAHGVTQVSVALMTADKAQYDELMKPMIVDAQSQVCRFIEQARETGLDVEVTAVDRKEVNKTELEELTQSLNVSKEVRWRPYFA